MQILADFRGPQTLPSPVCQSFYECCKALPHLASPTSPHIPVGNTCMAHSSSPCYRDHRDYWNEIKRYLLYGYSSHCLRLGRIWLFVIASISGWNKAKHDTVTHTLVFPMQRGAGRRGKATDSQAWESLSLLISQVVTINFSWLFLVSIWPVVLFQTHRNMVTYWDNFTRQQICSWAVLEMAKIWGGDLGWVVKAIELHSKSSLHFFFIEKRIVRLISALLYKKCSTLSFNMLLPSH